MIRRLTFVTLWVAAGSGIAGAVYWGFLNTPESSTGALALSALLALVTLALVAITVNGATLGWISGWSSTLLRRSIAGIPAFLPAAALVLAVWWDVGLSTRWVMAHRGEISAWFIATLGWADVTLLFTAVEWAGRWLRWIGAPVVALAMLGALLDRGRPAGAVIVAIRSALSPWRLLRVTLWGAVFVAVPWIYLVPWRPRGIPANSLEPALVAAKLLVAAIIMAAGVSMVIREAVGPPRQEPSS